MKQWKRLAALSSAIVMAAATLTYFPNDTLQNIRLEISASAEDASAVTWTKTESDGLTWTLYEDGTLNISGTGEMRGYNAYSIKSPACDNSNIKNVVIEDGITSIGDHAFDSCINLRSITLPDSITSIGMWAFYNCWNVSSIIIPDGVTSIEDFTFNSCISLTSITIPNSVTNIKSSAFHNCADLTSITIPDSVTSIGYAAFSNCDSLQTISLSCGSALKKSDFGDQADLVSYTNQHLLTKTAAKAATCSESGNKEYWTCEHCGKYFLSDDSNPETAKAVEQSETILPAIQHKNAELRNASEPTETSPGYSGDLYCPDCDKVVEKGYTYWNEGNLTWKLDADGTLNISGTGAMKAYDIDDSPATQKKDSVKAIVIEDGVTSIGDYAFSGCSGLTSVNIPEDVTSIGERVFMNCSQLASIEIPKSVTSIGSGVFDKCNNLTVYLESGSTLTSNALGVDESKIVSYWNEGNLTWKLDANGTLTISGTGAMKDYNDDDNPSPVYQNSNVKKVVIEKGVTSVGDYAFRSCNNLTSIMISNSVTSIGNCAIEDCMSLTSVTIPGSVSSIGEYAFKSPLEIRSKCSAGIEIATFATTLSKHR